MASQQRRDRVVVAGGGVAAVEAILALRALAGRHAEIVQLAPQPEFAPPAPSVATPFGFGLPAPLRLDALAADHAVDLRRMALLRVDTRERVVVPIGGDPVDYDHLLVAVGARRRDAVQGAITFKGPADAEVVAAVVDELAENPSRRLAVAVPSSTTWSLPAYELAIMATVELRSRGVERPAVCLVTPERRPLEVFGATAAQAVALLLAERGIALHTGCVPLAFEDGAVSTQHGRRIEADVVVALPEALGPYLPGLPQDPRGFIPADAHGRVSGSPDVYAAGDVTTFPLRQGGLAAQQADAAAESIAARMGAISRTHPFRPVLRGILLTGGAPLYLRAAVGGAEPPVARKLHQVPVSEAGRRALWWPPTKVAGRYLAPLLATARPVPITASPMRDIGYAEPDEGGGDDALRLALALADEDAACGDHREALHALDAARALSGGVLPDEYETKQREWLRRA